MPTDPKLERRRIAADVATPPDKLARLARSRDREVRRAVARNPNTPRATLLALGADFPEEILENPVFALLLLEEPALMKAMPAETAERLLTTADPPPALLAGAAAHPAPRVRLQALAHPGCPAAIFSALSRDGDRRVREYAARDPRTPPEALALLARDESPEARRRVAGNPSATPEILAALLCDASREIRAAAAQHPGAPAELLALLRRAGAGERLELTPRYYLAPVSPGEAAAPSPLSPEDAAALARAGDFGRMLLAGNPSTPPALLPGLLRDGPSHTEGTIRWAIANNPATPIALLLELALKPPHSGLEALVRRADAALLDELATGELTRLRIEVAGSNRAAPETLARLAADKAIAVRQAVLQNPRLPRASLEALAEDPYPAVRQAARARLAKVDSPPDSSA